MAMMRPRISCSELERIADAHARRSRGASLLVALDGENAWEYYPFNGWYFLRALYARAGRPSAPAAGDAVGSGG